MAGSPKPGRMKRPRVAAAALAALFCLPALGQNRIALTDLAARKPPDFAPAHAGEKVIVAGVVSAPAFHFPSYTLSGFQDAEGAGILQGVAADPRLDALRPGDVIEAEGVVSILAGMPTVVFHRLAKTGHSQPPAPAFVRLADLNSFPGNLRYLGRLVRTGGRVLEVSDTTAGGQILVGKETDAFKIFVPSDAGIPDLSAFDEGDGIDATGLALQFCAVRPYNRWFELLVDSPASIALTHRGWMFPPLAAAWAACVLLLGAFVLWRREHRLRKQRERLRRIYQLGEEVLGVSSVAAILERLAEELPGILGITRLHLYIHNRAAKTLDPASAAGDEAGAISLASPPGGRQGGAVACFHYRTLLVIPDINRSPFPIAGSGGGKIPKALLFVPMLAQSEVMGVLELDQDDRARDFTPDEQALAQHLANQIGVAVRLLDQRSVQEQLFRTEKLAAVGRLISGIVNELETPLSSISELAMDALQKGRDGPAERDIAAIASEAQKAAGMVARLVAFAGNDQVEARPVCITALLRNLIEFREGDWKASGIRVENLTSHEPLFVLGSQGQLEQVFLNLLVHAEQSVAEAPRKVVSVRTSVLGKRLLVEIAFSATPEFRKAEETAAVLGVTRSVVAGHGGEVRLIDKDNERPRFEVDLPAAAPDRSGAGAPESTVGREHARRMTALVIEPEEAAQRQILTLLAARGYRVVPVGSSDTALELAQRMRFDAALCSVHAPGLNWVELSERMQARVGGFILLSDRYDAELSADFEGDGRFVLPKPVQETDLDRVLQAIERHATAKTA
jgi:GAF domain-containing protein/CheY-like chemotaxis protein